MLKDFVEKIVSLGWPTIVPQGGLSYTDKPLNLIVPPCASVVGLSTLTGLVDVITQKLDGMDLTQWAVQVVSHAEVRLIRRETDMYGRRVVLASVKLDDGVPFTFGRFLDREEFVIGLAAKFVPNGDLQEVLKMCSTLQVCTVAISEDDGVSQRTTVKQGVTLKEQVTVKGRVQLSPYRTFREIEQPESTFVFRLKSRDGAVPECGLFEADGGKWKLDAMLAIKAWLDGKSLGLPVLA